MGIWVVCSLRPLWMGVLWTFWYTYFELIWLHPLGIYLGMLSQGWKECTCSVFKNTDIFLRWSYDRLQKWSQFPFHIPYPYPFMMWLCSSSHQEMESVFPVFESGLALWLSLAGSLGALLSLHVNRLKLACWEMRSMWLGQLSHPSQQPASH